MWPLLAPQIPYWSCPRLWHWGICGQQGSLGPGVPGLLYPRRCPVPATSHFVARWIREIRSQQRWAAALPSAEEFERVWHAGSVAGVQGTGGTGGSHPSWVTKDKEDSASRWCLQCLACTHLHLQTSVFVLLRYRIAGIFVIIETFLMLIAEMKHLKWNKLVFCHFSSWLEHSGGGGTRWKIA